MTALPHGLAGVASDSSVSAVIVNWNAGDALLGTISSLQAHPPSAGWEAIVVDNASHDGSIERARRAHPWVRFILNGRNRGLAAANNQGIVASRAPFIVICNPDIEVQPGAVDALLGLLERHPRAAFAVAKLVRPDGSTQTSAGDLPTLADALLGRQFQFRQRRRAPDEPEGFWWDGWSHDAERVIGHGMEACFLVRREALAEIGLQDEGFPLDWEGIDWSARAADAGWEVWFCPDARVVHLGGVSLRQAQTAWVLRSHRGMYRYFAKRRPVGWRPWLAAAFAVRALVKLFAVRARIADHAAGNPGTHVPADR